MVFIMVQAHGMQHTMVLQTKFYGVLIIVAQIFGEMELVESVMPVGNSHYALMQTLLLVVLIVII